MDHLLNLYTLAMEQPQVRRHHSISVYPHGDEYDGNTILPESPEPSALPKQTKHDILLDMAGDCLAEFARLRCPRPCPEQLALFPDQKNRIGHFLHRDTNNCHAQNQNRRERQPVDGGQQQNPMRTQTRLLCRALDPNCAVPDAESVAHGLHAPGPVLEPRGHPYLHAGEPSRLGVGILPGVLPGSSLSLALRVLKNLNPLKVDRPETCHCQDPILPCPQHHRMNLGHAKWIGSSSQHKKRHDISDAGGTQIDENQSKHRLVDTSKLRALVLARGPGRISRVARCTCTAQ
mmetsp:Transcript_54206/g.144558  ORF Transcript_54206/g.144558 Transcript_54206/m.144558 type:complete len:290 (-) Transcript_54206:691-1560(-)